MEFPVSGWHIELAQLLKAARLVSTGWEAKLAVKSGFASLNGEKCCMCAKKVFPGDSVTFDGKTIDVTVRK